jgi:hypothetical protein
VSRQVDTKCWQLYNNFIDVKEFDYLTNIGGYALPAKFQHIPAQRPKINFLVGRQLERPFQFSVSCVDKSSLKKKKEARTKFYVDEYITRYRMMYNQVDSGLKEVLSKKAEIEQAVQQKPENDEQQAQLAQAKKMLPQIESQIETIQQTLQDTQVFTMDNIKKLENLQRYTNKDFVEITAQKAMKAYREKLEVKQKSVQNFISSVVTGKDYYFVDYRIGDPLPTFRSLQGHNVFYQSADDVNWVEDLDWCGFEESMTPQDVISEFGLTGGEKKEIEEYSIGYAQPGNNAGPFVAIENGKVVDGGRFFVSSGAINPGGGINVKRVWWVAERVLNVIKRDNKRRPGRTFYDFIGPEDRKKQIIDRKDYHYSEARGENGKRISKWLLNARPDDKRGLEKEYDNDNVKTYDSTQGDEVLTRYIYDRYKGVIINNDIYKAQKDPIQPRSVDNYSKVKLPIVGPTFNNITMQPYSLIWATKELQRAINVVTWHRELMLALSGTKSLLYDTLFKPEAMSDQEFNYQKKLGTIKIQTKKKGAAQLQSSFNQWQMIDLSLSDSIQYLDKIIDNLDNQMGMVMGISRPAMGQVSNGDQVGTFQMSQQSVMLITEVIYAKHDEVDRRALSMMINIARQYLWDKDTILSYVENGEEEVLDIPAGVLNMADFEVLLGSNTLEERRLNEFKNYALQSYGKGLLPFADFSAIYTSDSFKEVQRMSEYFDREAKKLQADSEQKNRDHEMEMIKYKEQLRGEVAKFAENTKMQMAQLKSETDKNKLALDEYIRTNELQLRQKELADKETLGHAKVAGELEGTKMMAEVKQEHNRTEEDLKKLKITVDLILKTLESKKEKVST